jgi:1-acyl-sn-glycerol-3-phosphate acyltransferase
MKSDPLDHETAGERWRRRGLTFPAYGLLTLGVSSAFPALALLTLAIDLAWRNRFVFSRTLVFLTVYLWCETIGVIVGFLLWLLRKTGIFSASQFIRASFLVQQKWAGALFGAGRLLFHLQVEIEGGESISAARQKGPVLVFLRHSSTADTVLPVALVSGPYDILLRYVMKRDLLWDPCLDLYGQRLPNAFVRRGSNDPAREIERVRELSQGLATGDGILLYPEGTRFSEKARERIREKLAAEGDPEKLQRATQFRSVLPPRVGGALASIGENPSATVLFCAHTGFDGVRSFREFSNGMLLDKVVRAKFWAVPVADLPEKEEDRIEWLFSEWKKVDEFCTENATRVPLGPI